MTKQFDHFAGTYLKGLGDALFKLDAEDFWQVVEALRTCADRGSTIWLIGNGGSASLAAHMATDLQLAHMRAISLTDVAAITTAANDYSYEYSFVMQLDVLAKPGDVLIALSGSGNSPNVVAATEWAFNNGVVVVGMAGFKGGTMLTHHRIHIPVTHMGQAQDAEQIILHIITYWLMQERKQANG